MLPRRLRQAHLPGGTIGGCCCPAPADTPDGPSLGLGKGAIEAVEHAVEPFDGIVDELLGQLAWRGG